MPFALVLVGLILIITGARNTFRALGTELQTDFGGFVMFGTAIMMIGALGYVPKLKTFSNAFMALVLISMFLANSNNGLIGRFQQSLSAAPVKPNADPTPAIGSTASANTGTSSTGGVASFFADTFGAFGL